MKIDKVYISCCRRDLYLVKICIASIRYWNEKVPVFLIKDTLPKNFDTNNIERLLNVSVAAFPQTNFSYYNKLLPFITSPKERFLMIDADTVWLGDLVSFLEQYEEDFIAVNYASNNIDSDINKWFFKTDILMNVDEDYSFPRYLFLSGQMVVNGWKFKYQDFQDVLISKSQPVPVREDIFVGEDQGILNYIVNRKLKNEEISFALVNFMIDRWSDKIHDIKLNDIVHKKPKNYLIHWNGPKNGLISFLPQSSILKFFEKEYYSKMDNGIQKMNYARINRTIRHLNSFIYESLKKVYYTLIPSEIHRLFKKE